MKRFTRNLAWMTILLAMVGAQSAVAQLTEVKNGLVSVLNTINMLSQIVGTTRITPAYALHDWVDDFNTYYGNIQMRDHYYVLRDEITGKYFYWYDKITYYLGAGTDSYTSTDAFPISGLKRLNYSCFCSATIVYLETADFSISVWVGSLSKSGLFPPGQPYQAWLKSAITALASDCYSTPLFTASDTAGCQIKDTGYTVMRMDFVNYSYAWPMLAWCGDQYQY